MPVGERIVLLALCGIWTGIAGMAAQCAYEHRHHFEDRNNEWKWIVYGVLAIAGFVGIVWNAMKLDEDVVSKSQLARSEEFARREGYDHEVADEEARHKH
jgi:hypothetical protein